MDNGASSYHRFLDGDESGFAELIKMYARGLTFFVNGYVGNITVSEDIMEDTFCDLALHRHRFKGKSSFKTYLFSIARNKAVDYIRRNSKVSPMSEEELNRQSDETAELENTVITDERNSQINHALKSINTDYRMVLHLIFFEDVTYEQASLILHKSGKQMHDLVYRAKQSLKAAMEKEGFTYEE